MTPSDNLIKNFIPKEEGVVLHPYRDQASIPTIGAGCTQYENGKKVTMQDPPITLERAYELLRHEVSEKTSELNSILGSVKLNQNQFDALVDFVYNAGDGAFRSSTLLKVIKNNPNDPSIRSEFMKWNKIHKNGVLQVCPDLTARRKKEADLYFTSL